MDGAKDSSDVLQAAATSYGTLSSPSAGRNTSLSAVLQIVSPSREGSAITHRIHVWYIC